MIKRMVLISAGALLAGTLLFGRDVMSYVRTSAGYLKDAVHSSVPVEFQIQRARQMIKDLTPEVQRNMHLIAKEEVELKRLESQLADAESRQVREKEQLSTLKNALLSGREKHEFGGRSYTIEQVKGDLSNRFERYKTGDATLASLRQIQTARQNGLEAARQKLEGMLTMKRQLQVEVENLEARTQMIAAAETTSNFQFDDSRLGRVKELISDLRTQLDVKEKLVNVDDAFRDEIPVGRPASADIVGEINQYFGEKTAKTAENPAQKPADKPVGQAKPSHKSVAKQ